MKMSFSENSNTIGLLFAGDMSFDPSVRQCNYIGAWRAKEEREEVRPKRVVPSGDLSRWTKTRVRIGRKLSRIWDAVKLHQTVIPSFAELLVRTPANEKRMDLDGNSRAAVIFDLDNGFSERPLAYPFEKIAPFLRQKDFVLGNLETPLSDHKRAYGLFISDPGYAESMANAGISMVNLANNHIFDAGEIGFFQTIEHLAKAGVLYTGAGKDLENARAGAFVRVRDMKIVFLGYTQFCNNRFSSVADRYPGILPMDRQLILEDIHNAREKADLVFVNLHWGIENDPNVHPKQVEIAHFLIDNGADGIIGHHPHVPQGIEIYKKRPVFYSLGNFIFGQGDFRWNTDNYLGEIVIEGKMMRKILLHPISGQGRELFQPGLLKGIRANSLFSELKTRSAVFGTEIVIQNHVGCIHIR